MTVLDVASYILEKQPKDNSLTSWKLQKLVYYCQAWSLVWDEKPLFNEKIFAWVNGTVVKELYNQHEGMFYIEELPQGDSNRLSENQRDTIDHVLSAYGDKTNQWLSDLIHIENPWPETREGLKPGERGDVEIKISTISEYFERVHLEGKIL